MCEQRAAAPVRLDAKSSMHVYMREHICAFAHASAQKIIEQEYPLRQGWTNLWAEVSLVQQQQRQQQ